MSIDYNEHLEVVQELIEEEGREMTFIRFKQSPEEINKPWNGPDSVRTNPDATVVLWGVFVQPAGIYDLGFSVEDKDLLKKVTAICLVAPDSASPTFDIATANELLDRGIYRKIEFVKTLKPTTIPLLHYVGVSE